MLPYRLARQTGLAMAPLAEGWQLWLRPDADSDQLQELLRVHGQPASLEYLDTAAFDARLGQLYEAGSASTAALIEGIGEQVDLDSLMSEMPRIEDLLESDDEAPVIRLINGLFGQALRLRASDIHIETFEQSLVVRLRVDGHLREVLRPPRALSAMLVSRIKVMARLDIAEKRQPQDGRITLRAAGREVDVRVSTLPGIHGERVVMRVLDKQASLLALDNLGMPDSVLEGLRSCLARPNGIVLSTGPTGSGKTTTLYASLNSLNDGSRNILTVEDPVEYAIAGIGQTAINPRAGLTFASGLRAILRQDPDVIMLGEIRDQETAQIAVQASLTGHLVLSTLHTNEAPSAISRLLELGVPHYLIKATVLGVMAQRLVRTLCPHCKAPQALAEEDWQTLTRPWQAPLPGNAQRAIGCLECRDTGYHGRAGVYEIMQLSDGLKALINPDTDLLAVRRQAFKEGMRSLRLSGAQKVAAGLTTIEEVLRVTPQSEQK